jgi:ABC-type uncharacterized transport system permease subunit
MSSVDLWTAIGLFFLYIVVDVMYAFYTLAVTDLKPWRSATIGALMYVLLAAGVISYSSNPWYLIPIGMGSWIGTYIAVSIEKKRKAKNP